MAPRTSRLLLPLLLVPLGACASRPSGALPGAGPLTSVEGFQPERYLGHWYEIAKYPVSFEEGLVGVTATYTARDDGKIDVRNAGYDGGFDGELDEAHAKAWAPDPARPERLVVQFLWPFRADYWVVALDPDYRWAVVGEPERRYLWILAREPSLPDATYAEILEEVTALGYDVARLERMPQRPAQDAAPPPG